MIKAQRQQEIRAQKAAVMALRKQIGLVDRNSRRTYIRDFNKDFARFQEPAAILPQSHLCCHKSL